MHYLVWKLFSKAPSFSIQYMCITGSLKAQFVSPPLHSSMAPKHRTEDFSHHHIDRVLYRMTDSITAKHRFYFRAVKHLLTRVLSVKSGIYQTYFESRQWQCLQRVYFSLVNNQNKDTTDGLRIAAFSLT